MASAHGKSYVDVRPSNPLGRKASVTVFSEVCARHWFESKEVPQALARGWPICVDWSGLPARIDNMADALRKILENAIGARMRCVFWTELLEEVKGSGWTQVSGVKNQFATFHKSQVG